MATQLILGIFIILSFLFLIVGIFARVTTKSTTMSSLIFMSAIFFLLSSLMVLGEGIPEKTGEVIYEINTYGHNYSGADNEHWIFEDDLTPNEELINLFHLNRTTTPIFSYRNDIFINALGIALLLLSLILFYSSIFDLATGDGL